MIEPLSDKEIETIENQFIINGDQSLLNAACEQYKLRQTSWKCFDLIERAAMTNEPHWLGFYAAHQLMCARSPRQRMEAMFWLGVAIPIVDSSLLNTTARIIANGMYGIPKNLELAEYIASARIQSQPATRIRNRLTQLLSQKENSSVKPWCMDHRERE